MTHRVPDEEIEHFADRHTKPPRRKRHRKVTVAGIVKQITTAGIDIAKIEVDRDGKIGVVVGKVAAPTNVYNVHDGDDTNGIDSNEWDSVLQ